MDARVASLDGPSPVDIRDTGITMRRRPRSIPTTRAITRDAEDCLILEVGSFRLGVVTEMPFPCRFLNNEELPNGSSSSSSSPRIDLRISGVLNACLPVSTLVSEESSSSLH